MWQQCPICKGTGIRPEPGFKNFPLCPACQGKRIISTLSGNPPTNDYDPKLKRGRLITKSDNGWESTDPDIFSQNPDHLRSLIPDLD